MSLISILIMKNKFYLFLASFIILSSLFSIVCFADSSNGIFAEGDVYTFNSTLNSIDTPAPSEIRALFSCTVDGNVEYFDNIFTEFDDNYELIVIYHSNNGDDIIVYQGNKWADEGYRTLTFEQFFDASYHDPNTLPFLYLNGTDGYTDFPIYDQFRDVITKFLFNNRTLTSEENLCVTLFSIVASFSVVALPFVMVYLIALGITRLGVRLF